MHLWVAVLCVIATTISLILVAHRQQSRTQRIGNGAIQVAIWGLVWILWQPPLLQSPLEQAVLHTETESKPTISPPRPIATLKNLQVSGNGLRRDAFWDLPPLRLQNTTISSAKGWEFDWQQQLTLGDTLQLKITTRDTVDQPVYITLKDPFDFPVKRVVTKAGEKIQVALTNVPKLSGPQLYRLEIKTGTDHNPVTYTEPVPVLVHNAQPPKTLLWLTRPSFETAALSRWLRQANVPLESIIQLAPEIERRESSNYFASEEKNPLAATEAFELFILDSRLWPQLKASQRRQLNYLAREKSLLWLVMADSPEAFITYTNTQNMPLKSGPITQVAASVSIDQTPPPLKHSGYRPQHNLEKVQLQAQDGTPLYWQHETAGNNLGFILFTDSYRWLTSGFAEQYSRLWKTVLDHQLAQLGRHTPVSLTTKLPRAGRRISLCSSGFTDSSPKLMKYTKKAQQILAAEPAVTARLSAIGPCYSFWPKEAGWYHINGNNAHRFYIFAEQDWALWQQSLAQAETQQMTSARLGPEIITVPARRPIPRSWPALTLLLLLSLVWWRERFMN
ncbi:MAG: hypothetical protein K0U59_00340 [Gammaproteobacteria bacterium]|nr:hypothetical protein [Gammaproteobacteria bacterium]